jgi:hypothetical protein
MYESPLDSQNLKMGIQRNIYAITVKVAYIDWHVTSSFFEQIGTSTASQAHHTRSQKNWWTKPPDALPITGWEQMGDQVRDFDDEVCVKHETTQTYNLT